MVSQGNNQNIYVANGSGLLEFTGTAWNLYRIPNQTVVRSVKAVGNRIYTGAYMELGYWEENEFGSLEYTSLVPDLPQKIEDGEQFWNIESVGNFVIFQSLENLYLFNLENNKILAPEIPSEAQILKLFESAGKIYFQTAEEGLFTIENGGIQRIIPQEFLQDQNIVHLFFKNDELHLITQSGKFLSWNGNEISPFFTDLSQKLNGINIFSAIHLSDKSVILGTVAEGIYFISSAGEVLYHYNQENGLQNNTVLDLFLDEAGNVWAGLDNGISVINLNSPVKVFHDQKGKIGAVYTSFQKDDYLYLGTNQGLYFKKGTAEGYTMIEGTNGQVWSLNEINGFLFAGHNTGTFLVDGETAVKISEKPGTWTVQKYQEQPLVLVQGHYNGISFFKREGNTFTELKVPDGFPHSSKSIVTENEKIWIGNEHKGVFAIEFSDSLSKISEVENYIFPATSGITSGIFKFNDTLYFSAKNELFQYNEATNTFSEESQLEEFFDQTERISGKVVKQNDREIWAFAEDYIFKIGLNNINSTYQAEKFYIPVEFRNIPFGYENISRLNDDTYLLGKVDGYLIIDDSAEKIPSFEIRIDKIYVSELDGSSFLVKKEASGSFPFIKNNITFEYSIPEFKKFIVPQYSFRLNGLSNNWSDWKKESRIEFSNLPSGDYIFEVRAKINGEIVDTKSYLFEVAPPWYLSLPMILLYILLFLSALFIFARFYKKRHQKILEKKERKLKLQNLEAGQEIIKLKNEQLERDMATRNNELAVSTMSLIKKNEFLSEIRKRLEEAKTSAEIRAVIKIVNREIEGEGSWKVFKEAFSNADKDFFKKLKEFHPDLTPNDLKLCAYLRLNLSSKEIAPLLNISVKSVEIKRYRLRKKMNLDRNINLVDYILQI